MIAPSTLSVYIFLLVCSSAAPNADAGCHNSQLQEAPIPSENSPGVVDNLNIRLLNLFFSQIPASELQGSEEENTLSEKHTLPRPNKSERMTFFFQESAEEALEGHTRLFTKFMKDQCWKKSKEIPGRDPDRWRFDAAGNPVSYRLRGCEGCMCHEYDHIVPFSKGGRTEVDNCQILQMRANRYKGNEEDDPKKLEGYSCSHKFTGLELDVVEIALYGNIKREGLNCRIFSKYELAPISNGSLPGGAKPPKKDRGLQNCPDPLISGFSAAIQLPRE